MSAHSRPNSERGPQAVDVEEMLRRANEVPGVAEVLRVYASLDPAVTSYQTYVEAHVARPVSSSTSTVA